MKITGNADKVYNEVCEYLDKQGNKEIVVYIAKSETKEIRTLQQNKTFYKLFTDIGNHLGETKEDIKEMLLAGVFGTRQVTVGRITKEVNNEKHTSELSKEQGIQFIDTILAFCKKYDLPITIDSREMQNLYNSYQ